MLKKLGLSEIGQYPSYFYFMGNIMVVNWVQLHAQVFHTHTHTHTPAGVDMYNFRLICPSMSNCVYTHFNLDAHHNIEAHDITPSETEGCCWGTILRR